MNRPVDVLLHHLRGVAVSSNAWEAGFAKSILRQSRRAEWKPTPKQQVIMDRLVGDLFGEGECVVLEDID